MCVCEFGRVAIGEEGYLFRLSSKRLIEIKNTIFVAHSLVLICIYSIETVHRKMLVV